MKKFLSLFLASMLTITGIAFADDPVIVVIDNKLVKADKIVSPTITLSGAQTPISPGEIVVIEAKIANEYPTYVKTQTFTWQVSENGFLKTMWNQGSKVMFGAGMTATKIQVDLKASFTYVVGTENVIITKEEKVVVVVGNPTPVPPTPTPPTPTPIPPAPALTGAAKFAYDAAVAKGPTDKSSASVLAASFKGVAAQIGHNPALNDPKGLLLATKESNNAALTKAGIAPTDWDPWGVELQEYLYSEYQAKHLATIDDYKKVWEDIAQGLALVK